MTLIPQVRRATSLPLIAAGGICSGESMLAALALGAEAVQMGTVFALATESSAHDAFKQYCISLPEDATMLALKALSPTRMAKNALFARIAAAESQGASAEMLREMLGQKPAKRAIFEGEVEEGEVEIGQVVAQIDKVESAAEIVGRIVNDYETVRQRMAGLKI